MKHIYEICYAYIINEFWWTLIKGKHGCNWTSEDHVSKPIIYRLVLYLRATELVNENHMAPQTIIALNKEPWNKLAYVRIVSIWTPTKRLYTQEFWCDRCGLYALPQTKFISKQNMWALSNIWYIAAHLLHAHAIPSF